MLDSFFPRKMFWEELWMSEVLEDPRSILVRSTNFVRACRCCDNMTLVRNFDVKNKLYYKILQRISFILGFGGTWFVYACLKLGVVKIVTQN